MRATTPYYQNSQGQIVAAGSNTIPAPATQGISNFIANNKTLLLGTAAVAVAGYFYLKNKKKAKRKSKKA
jgi:hypothetical protein